MRMSRIPRLIGYGFMAAAALLAAVMKKVGLETIGPLPREKRGSVDEFKEIAKYL